jgi:hypothetical protein
MHSTITPQWMIEQGFSDSFAKRLFDRVTITDTCWIWTGPVNHGGYGSATKGKGKHCFPFRVHVASWMIHRGPIPNGLCVLHNCPGGDNPSCVNPDHLWLGTQIQNRADCVAKNRQAKGERNGGGNKLNARQVIEIRRRASSGEQQRPLAREFGITQACVSLIVTRQKWRHID